MMVVLLLNNSITNNFPIRIHWRKCLNEAKEQSVQVLLFREVVAEHAWDSGEMGQQVLLWSQQGGSTVVRAVR